MVSLETELISKARCFHSKSIAMLSRAMATKPKITSRGNRKLALIFQPH